MNGQLKKVAAVVITMGVGAAAWAQDVDERPAPRPGAAQVEAGRTPDLLNRLEQIEQRVMALLAGEQKKQAEAMFKEARAQVKALQEDIEKAEAQRREAMEKMTDQVARVRQELAALLTEEQQRNLRDLAGGVGQAGENVAQTLQRLMENLRQVELTPEQRQQVAAAREVIQDRVQKLRESAAGDRIALAREMRQLMQDVRRDLGGILTPEQQEKLRGLMERGPQRPERGQR